MEAETHQAPNHIDHDQGGDRANQDTGDDATFTQSIVPIVGSMRSMTQAERIPVRGDERLYLESCRVVESSGQS